MNEKHEGGYAGSDSSLEEEELGEELGYFGPLDNVNPYEMFEIALTSPRHLRSPFSASPVTDRCLKCTSKRRHYPESPNQCQPLCWKLESLGQSPLDGVYLLAKLAQCFSVFRPPSDAQQRVGTKWPPTGANVVEWI